MLSSLKKPHLLWLFMASVALAIVAVACAAQPEPAAPAAPAAPAIDPNELRTLVQEAVKDAIPEQQPVEVPEIDLNQIRAMVETAVAASAPSGATAEDLSKLVDDAVMRATENAVSAEDIEAVVAKAVTEAGSGQEQTLTAEQVQSIVEAAFAERDEATTGPKEPIVFADLNWDSAQIQNAIARFIVENGYGYPTDAIFGGTVPLWQGLLKGDINVFMEMWLPNNQDIWDDAMAKGDVIPVGKSLDDNWQSAFVVPSYVIDGDPGRGIEPLAPDLATPQDIANYIDLFATADSDGKALLINCLASWGCSEVNELQVDAYGLADLVKLQDPGSTASLFASVQGAYDKGDPWLGYMWGPSQPAAELDLTVLNEPACASGQGPETGCAYPTALIRIAVHPDLVQSAPEVVDFLRKWNFTASTQLAAENYKSETDATFEDVAVWYIQNQEDVWTKWVPADVAEKVKAAAAG